MLFSFFVIIFHLTLKKIPICTKNLFKISAIYKYKYIYKIRDEL